LPPNINLANRINKFLPADLVAFLNAIGEAVAKQGQNLYLVGGAIRDILLGLSHTDLDLVVEGDAITMAQSLRLNNIKITTHQAFGTANLKWNHWSVDIATARSEIYAKPGVLPEVTPSTINRDLFRRDFTINAMAVSLHPDNYGELIDPYRGSSDLKNKLIRVLHENSFVDDATRIWRAIRYEQRLGFNIEPDTLRLLKRDINMLDTISGDRIRHELELVLKEKLPEKAIHRADELEVLTKLNPALTGNGWLADKFNGAREMGITESSLPTVYMTLLVYHLNSDALTQLATSLRLTKALTHILRDAIELRDKLPALAKPDVTPSEVFFTIDGYPVLAIIANSIATDSTTIEQHIENYISRLSHIKPRLNGNDLKRLGITQGTEIKKLLHLLHVTRLDGKVITKQGEVRLINNWLRDKPANNEN
jgi:tRNA nucleotidyltransferase (CCA-adding enzyme)